MQTLSYAEVIVFEIYFFGHSTSKMATTVYAELNRAGWLKKTKQGRIVLTQKAKNFCKNL